MPTDTFYKMSSALHDLIDELNQDATIAQLQAKLSVMLEASGS